MVELREKRIAGAWVIERQSALTALDQYADVLVVKLRPGRYYVVTGDTESAQQLPDLFESDRVVACSQQRAWFVLTGATVRVMLDRMTALDLRPAVFPVGHTAAGRIGQIDVMLHARGDGAFDVFPLRSYAAALAEWMCTAGSDDGWSIREVRLHGQ